MPGTGEQEGMKNENEVKNLDGKKKDNVNFKF
jgi:hypothetical protein